MSSETSTEHVQSQPKAASPPAHAGMQPWQFFVLAGLGCATAVTFLARGQGLTVVLLMSLLMGTTVLVGLAALRAIRPLVSDYDDRAVVIGARTRAALEQEKTLALRTIKELEFDRAMGKVSDEDFREMSARLRTRAGRLIKQLDAGSGYRSQIEKDLVKRLGDASDGNRPLTGKSAHAALACPQCSTNNDPDAKFCKACGEKLG